MSKPLAGFAALLLCMGIAGCREATDPLQTEATQPPLENELRDDASPILSDCDDCNEATAGGCRNHGGDCTPTWTRACGVTRTLMADGKVECIRDCADGYMYRFTCVPG